MDIHGTHSATIYEVCTASGYVTAVTSAGLNRAIWLAEDECLRRNTTMEVRERGGRAVYRVSPPEQEQK